MNNKIINITGAILKKKKIFTLRIILNYKKKKKKIYISNFLKNKKNFFFVIGYQLDKIHKECSIIKISKNNIKIESDFFNSTPIYFYKYKNKFIFSNNIFSIHKIIQERPKFNLDNLANYYIFGYEAFAKKTIYKKINFINRNERLNVYFKNKKIFLKKSNLNENSTLPKYEFKINKFNQIKEIKNLVQNFRTALTLTGGLDSMVVLNEFSNLPNIKAFFIGNKISNDCKVGKIRAKKFKTIYKPYSFNFSNQKDLIKQVNEYSKITSGIGTCAEIPIMQLVKKIAKNHDYIFMGYGGELYRNYLKNRTNFFNNFTTPKSTLKKFIHKNFYKNQFKKVLKYNYDEKGLHNFYLNERYPKNMTRKNHLIRQFIIPINFFVNKNLYLSYLKKYGYKVTKNNFKKNFSISSYCKKINNINSFDIIKFFKFFKKIIIDLLKNENFSYLGIKQNEIINNIVKNKINKRDCWFLLRLLNLIIYLNFFKKTNDYD